MKSSSSLNGVIDEKINFFQSLKFRLPVYALSIALIPMVLMMVITYIQYRSSLEQAAKKDLLVTSKTQGQLLSKWFQEQLGFVNYLAQSPQLQSQKPESYIPLLVEAQKEMQEFDYFYVVGTDGMQIYKTDTSALVNLSDRDYFKRAMQGESLIASPVVSKATAN